MGGVRDVVAAVGPLMAHIVEQMRGDEGARLTTHDHQTASWLIQHRGKGDRSNARVIRTGVTEDRIDMNMLVANIDDTTAGAVVTSCGQVRNHNAARQVKSITYEAHPDAGAVMQKIAHKIAVLHRVGHLEVGDVALRASVSASHRREAFSLIVRVVEEVKLILPVWKKQEFVGGSHECASSA